MITELPTLDKRNVTTFTDDQLCKWTRVVCRIICIGLALFETWPQRHFLNEDGVSYLDMSDALQRHNWHLLINPIWSPLYPLLIGTVTWLTHPSARWEIPLVHLVNFVIFLAALASFEFLLRRAIGVLRQESRRDDKKSAVALPIWVWQLLGYSLFVWSTFGMIWAPRVVTPDLCVAAFLYLDGGLLLSLGAGSPKLRTSLLLGLTLGFGYLAKAILFPMAFLFMAIAFFAIGAWRRAVLPLAVTFLVFCAVAAPLVIAMSERVGKPSYSEAGNLNYAWHVNYVRQDKPPVWPFFRAETGPPAYLKHPVTLLHSHPEVYAFKEPLALTYPPRSDMAYWGAGTKVVFNLRNQLLTTIGGLVLFFRDPHILPLSVLIVAGFIVVFLGPLSPRGLKSIPRSWPLLIPGIVGPCLYLLIAVEPRYVAPFFVMVLVGLFPGILRRNSLNNGRRVTVWLLTVAASLMFFSASLVAYHLAGFPRAEDGSVFLQVGSALNRAGVRPGEEVAIMGESSDGCRWARLARVRIVAQILREDVGDFWRITDPHEKAEVYDAFVRAGATAVIAEDTPPSRAIGEWQQLGDTHYYVHLLSPTGTN